jgi:NADH-quinone oxidoreductase subunit G
MTVTTGTSGASGAEIQPNPDFVNMTIDGIEVSVPKGTLVIRAAELVGIAIPRFCDHPLLDPVGACRQCLVEVEGQRKPLASCTTTVTDGMVVHTQLTSPVADKAQQGNMEFLLINHPLDCPICDKGGECPLQNQAMSNGRGESRFTGVQRTYPKPIPNRAQILLDRERCVLCARCTRFSTQIAGDPFIELLERGALEQVGIYVEQPFDSYFSGNTVQICPVGALTSAAYRFRARPFDLVSTPTVCEHCASGCSLRADHRRGRVLRRLAGDDPQVNEEWNCDKGRFAFAYDRLPDRLTTPLVRDESTGELVPTSWQEALALAAQGLTRALPGRGGRGVGLLPGGHLTLEDAYAWSKFARVVTGTNDIDFRARPHSEEEAAFLASLVAGRMPGNGGVTYADLEQAPAVLLVDFEPEEESPIVFLRLRKAMRRHGTAVWAVAPLASRGLTKLGGRLVPAAPGTAPEVLAAIRGAVAPVDEVGAALQAQGAVILVGERAAAVPGTLTGVAQLAQTTGAHLAWVPRRAGERAALEAGGLPGLLPGGRPVTDAAARVDVGSAWGHELPTGPGRDTAGILAAAASGELSALVVGGVDPHDLPDPAAATSALEQVGFLVSLELRASPVTAVADVVLPVASVAEKDGTFVDWEGRRRPFDVVLGGTGSLADGRVLDALSHRMDARLGLPDAAAARHELDDLGVWDGTPPAGPAVQAGSPASPGPGSAVLATWPMLLDAGRMTDGEPHLAATRHRAVARVSPTTAAEVGVGDGDQLAVRTGRGELTFPVEITPMPDRVVWVPTNAPGLPVRAVLGVDTGALVSLAPGGSRQPGGAA